MRILCNGKIHHPLAFILIYIAIPMLLIMIFTLSCLSTTDDLAAAQEETETVSIAENDSISFYSSGLDGAGFQNVVAVDPFNPQIILSGGDVVAINRSTDGGATWYLSNGGMNGLANGVASLIFSKVTPGKVYAAVSSRGEVGGLYVSDNSGESWEMVSNVPQFSAGNNRNTILPENHPRSTGNLISLDESNGLIYVGTFKDGVVRISDEDKASKKIGMEGKYIRSIALDPINSNVLYVSAYNSGVWMTENAHEPAPEFNRLDNSPLYIEELKFIGGELYAVGGDGKAGKVYKVAEKGQTWSELLNTKGDTQWISIDGYVNDSNEHTIYVGANSPVVNSNKMYECILRSDNSGATWISLTSNETLIHEEVNGDKWWLREKNAYSMLGKNTYVASHIVIDPNDRQKIYVAGRSGIWETSNSGTDWYPLVRKMNVTVNRKLAADPNQLGRTYVANTDWVFIYSKDYMERVAQNKPIGSDSTGFSIALDKSVFPSKVYLAAGDRDVNSGGEIFSNPNPAAGNKWANESLSKVAGGKRPLDLAVWSPVRVLVRESGISLADDRKTYSEVLERDSKGIMEFSPNNAGNEAYFGASARINKDNNCSYSFFIRQNSENQLLLELNKTVNSESAESYRSFNIGSNEAEGKYFLRYEIKGVNPTLLKARAWKAGNPEPDAWQIEYSDNSYNQVTEPGSIGLLSNAAHSIDSFYAESLPESYDKEPIIVTIVEDSGVWRKANGKWQIVNDKVTGEDGSRVASLYWPSGSNLVYLYDHKTGIWRSNDKGISWTNIWNKPTKNKNTGYVIADPINPGRLFVSSQDGIYRLDNAGNSTVENGEIIPLLLQEVPNPGPIAIDEHGNLYLTSLSTSLANPGRLFKSKDGGDTWEDISDDYYKNNAAVPSSIAATIDDYIYLSFTGSGVIVGK